MQPAARLSTTDTSSAPSTGGEFEEALAAVRCADHLYLAAEDLGHEPTIEATMRLAASTYARLLATPAPDLDALRAKLEQVMRSEDISEDSGFESVLADLGWLARAA